MATQELQAALFDRFARPLEHAGLAERRRRLLSEASGAVLDVGAGTGANLAHFRDVDRVVALEPAAGMARRLERRLEEAAVPVEVVVGTLDDAALPSGSFDTVVCTLVLCTVPDLHAALRRIHDLLTPDGRLLFLEHVRTPGMWGRIQHAATPMWKTVAAGCHLDRDPLAAMRETEFVITDCEHFIMPLIHNGLGTSIQGVARPSRRRSTGAAA